MAQGFPGQPWTGHRLPNLLKDCGLADVTVTPYAHWWRDFAEADAITPMRLIARIAREAGSISESEHDEWLQALDRAVAADRFTFVSTVLIVRGQKPA